MELRFSCTKPSTWGIGWTLSVTLQNIGVSAVFLILIEILYVYKDVFILKFFFSSTQNCCCISSGLWLQLCQYRCSLPWQHCRCLRRTGSRTGWNEKRTRKQCRLATCLRLAGSKAGKCHQTSNISHTKSQILNVFHLILQLSLPNPFKPGV